jgi:hypothetical protein
MFLFGISPRESVLTDPQQCVMLMSSYKQIHHHWRRRAASAYATGILECTEACYRDASTGCGSGRSRRERNPDVFAPSV